MRARALVTGAAGFIGHHLVLELLRRGYDVIAVDNFYSAPRERLTALAVGADVAEADVRDGTALRKCMRGVDVVFHEAALASVQQSILDPVLTNDVNVGGTIAVMEAAAATRVRRVILAGSASVYGDNPVLPLAETEVPRPQSPYAVSKLAAEYYLHAQGALSGVESVALRYFNVFGPGQDPSSAYAAVVPKFILAALSGQPPIVNGDGRQTRDFTYVADVVTANLQAATASGANGGTFNIGCGRRFSLLHLIATIESIVGRPLHPIFGASLPADVRDSQADIRKAARVLQYVPRVPFELGVRQTILESQSSAAPR